MVLVAKLVILLELAWLSFGLAWWYWPAPCQDSCSVGLWFLSVMLFGFWVVGEFLLALMSIVATSYLIWHLRQDH